MSHLRSLGCGSWSGTFLSWLVVKGRCLAVVVYYFILVIILHFLQFPCQILIKFNLRYNFSQFFILRMLRNKLRLISHKRKFNTCPGQILHLLLSLHIIRLLLLGVRRMDLRFSLHVLRFLSWYLLPIEDLNGVLGLLGTYCY